VTDPSRDSESEAIWSSADNGENGAGDDANRATGHPIFDQSKFQAATSGLREVLSNGPFLRLWIAQLISQTANNMVNFALLIRIQSIIEIHGLRQANTAISLVILAFSLPAVLFGPIAGVIADRFDKRWVLLVTNLLRAVAMVLFLLVRPGWHVETILIATYLITFVFGIAGQFFAPAQGAMIPTLVPRVQLVQANGLFNLTFTGAQLLGFATLGPLLVKVIGVDALFVLTLVAFLICAGLVSTLPHSPPKPAVTVHQEPPTKRLWSDIRAGLVFILQDPMLMRAIAYLTLASTTFLMVAALGPEFITTVIGLPKEDIVFVVLPAGVGVVAGVALVGRVLKRIERSALIDIALAMAGLSLLGMVLAQPFLNLLWLTRGAPQTLLIWVVGMLATVLGVCNAFILVPSQTMLQERSHEHVRARVYATFFTISNTVAFVPIFFAAAMADLFGVTQVLTIVAIIVMSIGLFSIGERRAAEEARWQATRTRHREGPETLTAIKDRNSS
jgi:MFS family permease